MFNDLRIRLRSLFLRDVVESELQDELRFHLDREAEKNEHSGLTREEAMRRARLVFGGEEQIRANCREARGTQFLETALQDLRYGLRAMGHNPGFFAIAALTMALGIGASTAVFSIVDSVLLTPLPYPRGERVAMLWRGGPLAGIGDLPWAPFEYSVLARTEKTFQNLGAFKKDSFNLTGMANPELLEGVRNTAGFFRVLGVPPALGRVFTTEEDRPGHERVVVLSNQLWRSRFGADPGVLGKAINLNGTAYTVIGVMPAGFRFPNQEGIPAILDLPKETQLWVPMALAVSPPRGPSELGVIAELKRGESATGIDEQLRLFQARLEIEVPQEKGWSSRAVALRRQIVSDARQPLLLLLGAVSIVLLIACANVAGLVLNRSLGRRRELTLRGAMGAKRSRLIRQLLTESLLLSLMSGVLGIVLGLAFLLAAKYLGPDNLPHLQETGLNLRVIAYSLGITVITGVLFGLAPALGATRMNMMEALKEGGQRSIGSVAPRMRNALLVIQVAMALVLVVAAGLLVRTFYSMLCANAGFDAEKVVTFELPLPTTTYEDTERMAQLYQQVLLRLQSIPAVRSVGFASVVPMGGAPDGTVIRIPEHPAANPAEQPYANYSFTSPGYFTAIGAPLLRGRDFSGTDALNAPGVTIINNAMANKYFPGEDPIGKQVGVGSTKIPVRTIVGVIGNIKHASLRETPEPEMLVPFTQNEIKVWPAMQTMQFAVRTKIDDASIGESIRQAVHAVDPNLPVAKFATLTTLVDTSMTADRFSMILVGSFGVLALILASIGMYGVISYSVMQRTPEIGIRMALGAKRSQIFLMVLRDGTYLAMTGTSIGLVAALAAARLMRRFLYGVQPTDPTTFLAVPVLLVFVVLLACYLPGRKAMRVDPMIALRYE